MKDYILFFWGVATPSSLIQDKLRTPFNIGQAIILTNFKLHESHSLTLGFKDKCLEPLAVLQAIFDWTGGQPFLTQKICSLVKKNLPKTFQLEMKLNGLKI